MLNEYSAFSDYSRFSPNPTNYPGLYACPGFVAFALRSNHIVLSMSLALVVSIGVDALHDFW